MKPREATLANVYGLTEDEYAAIGAIAVASAYLEHQLDGRRQGADVEETLRAIESGTPLRYKPQTILNFNSLQIIYAEPYVFFELWRGT